MSINMHRYILIIAMAICILTVISACDRTPHDRAYYMAHPDEAKVKLDACNQDMELTLSDPECAAAGNALESIHEKERAKRQSSEKHKDYPKESWMF